MLATWNYTDTRPSVAGILDDLYESPEPRGLDYFVRGWEHQGHDMQWIRRDVARLAVHILMERGFVEYAGDNTWRAIGESAELIRAHLGKPKAANRPTVPDVAPLVRDYYVDHCTGGSLHIVLDDENVEDGHVAFCIAYAEVEQDEPGIQLGRLLMQMTRTQRMKLANL